MGSGGKLCRVSDSLWSLLRCGVMRVPQTLTSCPWTLFSFSLPSSCVWGFLTSLSAWKEMLWRWKFQKSWTRTRHWNPRILLGLIFFLTFLNALSTPDCHFWNSSYCLKIYLGFFSVLDWLFCWNHAQVIFSSAQCVSLAWCSSATTATLGWFFPKQVRKSKTN